MLDTCTFLWIISDSPELSGNAKTLFATADNEVYLSTISVWEIFVKNQLGKLRLPQPLGKFISEERILHRIQSLTLQEDAVFQLARLPVHHNDPFDRMLICQAIAHGMTLLTPDKCINQYPVLTMW